MPSFGERFESIIGGLLQSVHGHDAGLFTKTAPFKDHPKPTITIVAPECGPSGSELKVHHTPLEDNRFPELKWEFPSSSKAEVIEYLIVVEDPDAPLPWPIVHGIYYSIPGTKTSVLPSDFEKAAETKTSLEGGFKHGANRMKSVWGGPRPVLGHGAHRYMFQVVALSAKIEGDDDMSEVPTRAEVEKAIAGKIVAWGVWIGTFERKLA